MSTLSKINNKSEQWQSASALPMTEANLDLLFKNKIPAIILPRFLSVKECQCVVENLKSLGMGTYAHVTHAVGRLGLAQMEYHLKGTKADYFKSIPAALKKYSQAINGANDPVEELISCLAHNTKHSVGIAKDSEHGQMFAGGFRNVMTLGHKHFDFAQFEALGWTISEVSEQLSWNLYLNEPTGGDLLAYNRPYSPEDEFLRVKNEYYYENAIVDGVQCFRYKPRTGDIVIINCRNIHEVEPVTGDRFTLSSFIGRLKNKNLILWS